MTHLEELRSLSLQVLVHSHFNFPQTPHYVSWADSEMGLSVETYHNASVIM